MVCFADLGFRPSGKRFTPMMIGTALVVISIGLNSSKVYHLENVHHRGILWTVRIDSYHHTLEKLHQTEA